MRRAFHRAWLSGLVFTSCLVAVPMAQATRANSQTEWSDTAAEVVVKAHIPGPAMWKLTKGESTVWVLGLLTVRPEPLEWNSGRFRRVLKGSKTLIFPYLHAWQLPPERTLLLPGKIELQDVITASTYHRFEARVKAENLSMDAYTGYQPIWAAVMMTSDVFYQHALWDDLVPAYIPVMAKEYEVPLKPVERQTAQTMLTLYKGLNAKGSEACLNDYLDSVDYDLNVMPGVAKAWAGGDLTTLMRDYQEPGLVKCILADEKTAAAYRGYAIDDMVKAIDDALASPGKSTAIVPLSDLLRRDGVLDRLKGEGVEITSPPY